MKFCSFRFIAAFVLTACVLLSCESGEEKRILVFSKTKGFYHESIPAGVAAVMRLGQENGFKVDTTKDAAFFNEETLKKYDAVVFLNTTGNVLDPAQQVQFERYIQAGGGYVGIHSAADTEYEWPWYNHLIGAYFLSHPNNPNVRKAVINVTDTTHESTVGLPRRWERTDEWYNYKSMNPSVNILAFLDESTYEGGEHGDEHRIAWYHEYDGGRAFYTGGGHTDESYSEPLFLGHILGGIRYAMGTNTKLDYSKAYAVRTPEENRFRKAVLSNDLNEPMELAVAPDGRVFFVERGGNFYAYNPGTKTTDLLHVFKVMPDTKEGSGNGLLGVTLDPDFKNNQWIYFFYTPDKLPANQYVSRFTLTSDGKLDLASEVVVIRIPIELEVSAHTGGSLAWDGQGNLYISTGDNTVPFESEGFAPIDERQGRLVFDAQRSSGNTNDLRGKILRIHPEKDGSYTVPDGNLFPKGTANTLPEIYAMGCRNPYRISVDKKTGIVYWGEIGPDSGEDGVQGPRGYDEFNQASKPGNYGWPYFVGNNIAYKDFDFESRTAGDLFTAQKPVNASPNNTGQKELPAATSAMIWYPYDKSEEFPLVGVGGRSAMAGPVFHYDHYQDGPFKFPVYYDKALFVFDWMRNWVFAVRMDGNHTFKRMERFMPQQGDFRRPIDMDFGPDGTMYLLEYGSVYGIDNVDARLVRIDYNAGNRAPLARIRVSDSTGHAPLKVTLRGNASKDYDEDDVLTHQWSIEGKTITESNPEYTFERTGTFPVVLKVTDKAGLTSTDTVEVRVGNTIPVVKVVTEYSPTFFFADKPFAYKVQVNDKEDKRIDTNDIGVSVRYIANADPLKTGHQPLATYNPGKSLLEGSDCKACHQYTNKSVGPAFVEVAKRYKSDKTAVSRLADKVIKGGGGVWGEHAMNAHPQLSREDAMQIVEYVLSLAGTSSGDKTGSSGVVSFTNHKPENAQARFVITASYTDKGGESKPLTGKDVVILQPNKLEAEFADKTHQVWNEGTRLGGMQDKSFFAFRNIDLRNIRTATFNYSTAEKATIEVRINSIYGKLVATHVLPATKAGEFRDETVKVQDPGGKNALYFIIRKQDQGSSSVVIDWVRFNL